MEEIAMACPPGTVAAYLRVSSQVQRRRETIASQHEAVLDHARRRGWLIPDTCVFADDGFSGATLERPALEALRDGVASGEIETVLVWSIDRLSRNFAHQILLQEEFARTGATIACVQEPDNATPQGMLLRQILSVISEYERTQIAERSRRGKIHRARQGSLNMLSRPPYGYRLIRKTETCGARLEVDDTEACVVRRIYDLHVRDGLKMHEIGPRLDAQGVRPRHAQHWSCSTVAVILRNEAYIGKAAYLKTMSSGKRTRHNRTGRQKAGAVRRLTSRTARAREEWIELPVPVIVDEAVFARAQQQRAVNRRFSPRKTIEQTLLQGLCVCGHCGYAMGRHSGGSSGTTLRRHYYRCHGIDPWRRPHGAVCDNPVVRADELDEAVWKEVLALLENPELIQCEINRRLAVANDTVAARRRIDTLHSELARIETRLRRLLDAYQEEVITLDELRERKGPLQTRQQSIVSELKALQTAELDRASRLSLATTMERFLQRMREGAQSVFLAERQRIVRLLVREVQVGKETVTICHSIPIESAPPDASGPSRNEPSEKASGHGALLVPRCRQVIEQDVETGLEQRLPAFAQKREKRALVDKQLVQATIQGVAAHHLRRPAQQVPHGAVLVPVPVQPPLAARINQLAAHLRLQHIQPARALPAYRQPGSPEPIQLQALPHRQRQPARPPLARPTQPQRLELDPHHLAVQLRHLPVRREQRHRLRTRLPAQHLDRSTPTRPLAVVDLAQIQLLFLGAPWKGASSQWVRIPRSNCRFRLVAARAIYGGNDVGRSTLVSKGRLGRFSDHTGRSESER